MTEDDMRSEGEARKTRSIARLKKENIPTIDHLPWIECDPATVQSVDAIARRTMVIGLLAVHAEPNGMPRELLQKYLFSRAVTQDLTPNEKAFLALPNPTEKDRAPFTWQYESAYVLLWSLGYFGALGSPTRFCTAADVASIIAPRTVLKLIADAHPRAPGEIFDECDLIFRYHWTTRNAALTSQPPPAGLLHPVCHFRHYALNWLTAKGTPWDNIDTST